MHHDNTLIYNTLISLGVQKAAESIAKSYDPADGISPEIFARGAAEAFFYGKGNFSETELRNGNGLSPVLTELQRSTAYRLGQIFQENQTSMEEVVIKQKKAAAKKSGSVAQSQKGNVYYDGDRSRLTERQKVSVRALEKLAQALGVDFYLYESERDAAGKPIGANGWYDQKTGDIHIDLNAGEFGEGTILFTAAHELTHFLRQWSPSKFKVLSDFLVEQYGAKGQSVADLVRNQQAKAKRNGRSLSWMQAYEEMVADSMETMLFDGTVIEKLTKLSAKDKGLVQKLLDWFKGFAAKLKRAYQALDADSAEGRLVAEMTDTIDRLQTLFTEGLAQAGENYRMVGGQKNSAQEEKTVVYYCQRSPKLVSETEVKTLLDKVRCKEISGHGYIPIRISTPGIVQERLFAEDIPMVMPVSKAYQAMSADLGPKKGKNVRGHDLSPQDLVEIIKRMDSPDYVFSQPKNDRGIEVIKYGTPEGNIAVIIEFSNNINPAYLNGYKGGAYNIAITAFEIDGGAVGLFQYAKEQEWQEVFNKEKEGNPAKKFPTTRPFAIEQDFPDNSIPHDSDGVNKYSDRDSTGPRFDSNVQDAASNELRSDQEKPTVHSLLMETDASKVKNATERKNLKEYQQTAARQLAEQQKLDKLQAELDALPKDNRQTSRARFLRDEIIKTKNRLQICQSILTRLETNSPLTYLIHREIKPRLAEAQKTAMPQALMESATLPSGQNSKADLTATTKYQQNKKQSIIAQTGPGRWYEQEKISVVNFQDRGILGAGNPKSPDMMTTLDTNQATISSDASENGFLRSLPVSSPKSIEEAVVSVNPHFADNVPEYRNNCGNCTVAYDMQRRGYNVEAMPALHMYDSQWAGLWDGFKILTVTADNDRAAIRAIKREVKSWGAGSRGTIFIRWNYQRNGHYFNIENDRGIVRFIDPQNGSVDCEHYFEDLDLSAIYFGRTDNIEPSAKIKDHVKPRGI